MHVDPLTAPDDLRLLTIQIPEGIKIETVDTKKLPKNWRTLPAPAALQALGTAWLKSTRTVALSVPSAIIESERNLLLNPRHPDIKRLKVVEDLPFSFDPRLGVSGILAPPHKAAHIRTTRSRRA